MFCSIWYFANNGNVINVSKQSLSSYPASTVPLVSVPIKRTGSDLSTSFSELLPEHFFLGAYRPIINSTFIII